MLLDVRTINRLTEPFRLPKVTQAIILDKSKVIQMEYLDETKKLDEDRKKASESGKNPKANEFAAFRSALDVVNAFTKQFSSNAFASGDLQASWQFDAVVMSKNRGDWCERFDYSGKQKDIYERRDERNQKLNDFIVGLRQKMLSDATKKAQPLTAAEQKALDAI